MASLIASGAPSWREFQCATVGAVAQHHLVRDLIQGRKSAAFDFRASMLRWIWLWAGQRWLFSGWPHRRARRNTPMTSYEWCCKASGQAAEKSAK